MYYSRHVYGSKGSKSIGVVKITISTVKYLVISNATVAIHVEGNTKAFKNINTTTDTTTTTNTTNGNDDDSSSSSSSKLYHEFNISEVTSDILITLSSDSNDYVGRIVIPIPSLLGISKPKQAAVQTYQFFPVSPDYQGPIDLGRFQSGLKELPSIGMTKDKRAIGFLCVTVDVDLSEPCWKLYLSSPYISTRSFINADQTEQNTKRLKTKELTVTLFQSLQRISRSTIFPKVLSPITSFPQVLIVITVFAFTCFWIQMWQIPFLIIGLVAVNGMLSSGVERFSYIMTWNNCVPGSQYPFTKYFEDILNTDDKFLTNLHQLLSCITSYIDIIERTSNLISFSDVCVSYVFYTTCLLLGFVISLLLSILSTRFVVVLIGTLLMLLIACRSVLFNLTNVDDDNQHAPNSKLMDILESVLVFLHRIPNDLDLEHRLIAKEAIVKYDGIEMQDCRELCSKN